MKKVPLFVPGEKHAGVLYRAIAATCLLRRRDNSCIPGLLDMAMLQACSRQQLPVIHSRTTHSRQRTNRCLSAGTSSSRSASLPARCSRDMLPTGHLLLNLKNFPAFFALIFIYRHLTAPHIQAMHNCYGVVMAGSG